MAMVEKMVVEIIRRLERKFGLPRAKAKREPLSELIFTILSQNTSDVNRDRAYARLTALFPSWELLSRAPTQAIASAIKVGGLANVKARRLKMLLTEIKKQHGTLSLDFLGRLPTHRIKEELTSFAGVGPKTAACVLLFSLGRPAFPVDTHVFRVAKRLGLLPGRATVEQAHEIMERITPRRKYFSFHINLIKLGRTICLPRKPQCPRCPLKEVCAYYQSMPQKPEAASWQDQPMQ